MRTMIAGLQRALLLLTVFVLAACSGGGGGGDGGSGSNGDGDFTLSVSSVAFEGFRGGYTPPVQSVTVTVTGTQTVFIGVSFDGAAVVNAELFIVDPVAGIGRIDITPAPTSGAGMVDGINTATVTVFGCYDALCNNPLSAGPKVIDVTYNLKRLSSINQLNFTAVEGAALPPAQAIQLDIGQPANQNWSTGIQYHSGSGWLHLDKSSGNSLPDQLNVSVGVLPVGVYQATLSIATTGITHFVFVTCTVQGVIGASESPVFNITAASQPGDLSKVITVQSNDPASPSINWSATVNVPWLMLSPSSGDTAAGANQLTVSLVGSEMGGLKHHNRVGELLTHTGTITLTSPPLSPTQVPVTLKVNLPMVEVVSPNETVNGVMAEVVLRGHGFSGATSVVFGSSPAVAVTPLNDSEIHVTHPGLNAGTHVVSVPNNLGVARNNAAISVVAPPAFGGTSMASAGTKSRIIYDAVRKAIYIANTGNGSLDKHAFENGMWVFSTVPVTDLQDIALAVDDSYLLAVTNTSSSAKMHEINPENLAILFTSTLGGFNPHTNVEFDSFNEAVTARRDSTNNDPVNAMRVPRNSAVGMMSPALKNGLVGATRDGRRVLLGSRDNAQPGPVYYFDSGNHPDLLPAEMNTTGINLNVTAISSDRTGSRWVLNTTQVYNNQLLFLDSLPITTVASILSHDGSVAYTVDANGKLRKFSLATSPFAEVGSGTTLSAPPGAGPVMALSHDGGTIFIVGNQNLIIMPAP